MDENFFNSIKRSKEEIGKETIAFQPCSTKELVECFDSSVYDVDYVLLSGKCKTVLLGKTIESLLSNCYGQFKRAHKIRAFRKANRILIKFLDLRPFSIALDMKETSVAEGEEESKDVFIQMQTEEYDFLSLNDLNRLLDGLTSLGEIPFRTVQAKLLELMPEVRIALVQYGQKQPVEYFSAMMKDIEENIDMEVAIGIELELLDSILVASNHGINIGNDFYPLFLSPSIGSILQKQESIKDIGKENCFRMCLYNTSFHERKSFKHKIRLSEFECDEKGMDLLKIFPRLASHYLNSFSSEL